MRKRTLTGLIFLCLLSFASPLWAQSTGQYVYDALGRLTQVIDPSGNVATYNYDAVGNLLSITRSTTSPSALAIFGFSHLRKSHGEEQARGARKSRPSRFGFSGGLVPPYCPRGFLSR
jgi:YD repeat-containing protein